MELKDLVGIHELSGLDQATFDAGYGYDDAVAFHLILDDITYKIMEDPCDGYRSYLGEITVCTDNVTNKFPPQIVEGKMSTDAYRDVIIFTDIYTDKIVLEIGTDNCDDYYPCCVMNWQPENLAINNNVNANAKTKHLNFNSINESYSNKQLIDELEKYKITLTFADLFKLYVEASTQANLNNRAGFERYDFIDYAKKNNWI